MKNRMLEMYELQNTLNINTNGKDWTKGITNQHRLIEWYRCMYMEAAEAIDSLNWKHWKDINSKDDLENVKVELVDIWHFLMSQHIVECGNTEIAYNECYLYYEIHKKRDKKIPLIQALENIIKNSSSYNLPIEDFFMAVDEIENFGMEKIYTLYIGKNCLNQFRQDNGYKDGTYIKMWNGLEDNVHMQQILEYRPNISFDELYVDLSTLYTKLTK